MRRITLTALSLLCAFLVASCSDDANDSYDDAKITVSVDKLDYSKEGGSNSFDVTVNEKNNYFVQWENSTPWGEVTRNGKTVTVVVQPNTTPDARTATLLVLSQNGGLQEPVIVTQSASGLIFDAIPDEITFNRLGGENKILVNSNATDWTVEGSATWLTIQPKQTLGEVKIIAQPNTDEGERATVLTVRRGSEMKQVAIIQKGTMELVLPYLNFGASITEAIKFETDRGNFYYLVPESWFNDEEHNVMTLSLLTPKIQMDFEPGFYNGAIVWNSIAAEETEKIEAFIADYGELLVENGFTMVSERKYSKPKENSGGGEIVADLYNDAVQILIVEGQPGPMPTFDTFPYGYITWGVGESEIDAYEASIGGVVDASQSDGETAKVFTPKADDPVATLRAYIFKTAVYTNFDQNMQDFKESSRMFYFASDGKHYMTREYEALLAKEGFTYYGTSSSGSIYYTKPSSQGAGFEMTLSHRVLTDDGVKFVRSNIWEEPVEDAIAPTRLRTLSKQEKGHPDKFTQYRAEDILK